MSGLLPPGGPVWGFLDPKRGRQLWHVRCPVCCAGRMPLGDRLDGGYGFIDLCYPRRCSPIYAAHVLARLTDTGVLALLVDPDTGPWAMAETMGALRRNPVAREAWRRRDFRELLWALDRVSSAADALGACLLLIEQANHDELAA